MLLFDVITKEVQSRYSHLADIAKCFDKMSRCLARLWTFFFFFSDQCGVSLRMFCLLSETKQLKLNWTSFMKVVMNTLVHKSFAGLLLLEDFAHAALRRHSFIARFHVFSPLDDTKCE